MIRRRIALSKALVLALLAHALLAWAEPAVPLAVTEIAPGVFVHEGRVDTWRTGSDGDIANMGFVVGERCVAVVDTGSTPALARRLRASVARHTPLPICAVVITHAHPDHALGATAFAGEGIEIVGHARLAQALALRGPSYLKAVERDLGVSGIGLASPTRAIDGTGSIDLGGRILELRAWPTAHTDADLSVFDVRTRTLFTGDLLFDTHLPVVDGKLLGWLAVMDELVALQPAHVVPGHGSAADWPTPLHEQRRYLEHLRDALRTAIADGRSLADAIASVAVSAHDRTAGVRWALVDEFHQRNLSAAYAELEWE